MENVYDTDVTMRQLWLSLAGDFRTSTGMDYASGAYSALLGGIKEFRAYKFPARCQAPHGLFKTEAQLENLFKRYRFKEDVYSQDDLERITMEKFIGTQERIATPLRITPIAFRVLQRARVIATRILGSYDLEEHQSLCRFGKRACAHVPYSKSYLDFKMSKDVSGSPEHIAWFNNYLLSDRLLSDTIAQSQGKTRPSFRVCETLAMSLVPKSFKSLRTVKPPTLIGSFYTYGLGRVIQARLLKEGLDIRRLQEKHKRLVKINSVTRNLVTADLSAASDSLTRELLRRLLPTKWYHTVMCGVVPNFSFGGKSYSLNSVATMGDGHTFPLQTLIFYCLIKAIGELSGKPNSYVSVYGDDLIYPRGLHRYVKHVFPLLHLKLNGDKTYVLDFFRESCGSDYYHGFDVRPFQYEGGHQLLDRQPYAVFLYKLYNGLKSRWCEEEIPQTLEYLRGQLILSQACIFRVPPSFPDGSGIHCESPYTDIPYSVPITYSRTTFSWVFYYLHVCADFRVIESQSPYYWERLRSGSIPDEVDLNPWDQGDEPLLRWRKATLPPITVRSRITGRRFRRLVAGVSSKTRSKIVRQTGSTSSWI